jgi:RimJ/RimL family protein N-acetyltransferase
VPVTVRRATARDAEAFARVVAEVAEEGRWVLTEAPVDVPAFADRVRKTIADGADALWVLEREGKVVGATGLHASGAAGVASLGMSVVEAERGRGGGRRLLEAALRQARESRLHKVELEVFVDNARAIAMYASFGFEVEGLRREHYLRRDGTRRSVLLMARILGG